MRLVAALLVLTLGQSTTPSPGRSIPIDRAVLQGRVLESGSQRPVAGALVQALSSNGTFDAATGADGRYEFPSLKPDTYTVAARANGFVDGYYSQNAGAASGLGASVVVRGGQTTSAIDVWLQPAGHISGRILDPKGRALAGVEIELMQATGLSGNAGHGAVGWAQSGGDGSYRLVDVAPGDYVVRAYVGRDYGGALDRTTVFAPTFYPGVSDRESARPLRVYAGQELFDADFPLGTTRTFTVAGTIVDESGDSLEGLSVNLTSTTPNSGSRAPQAAVIGATGHFEFRDVVPGEYVARIVPRPSQPGPPMPGAVGVLTFSKTLTVVDADLTDVDWRVATNAWVGGRVMADVGVTGTLGAAAVELRTLRLTEREGRPVVMSTFGVRHWSDGSFVELPAAAGPSYFEVTTPPGWMVKTIRLDGYELEDGPVELAAGRRHVEIVVTDRVSGVSGVVLDARDRALPNYSVVVFPADAAQWRFSLRTIREERTDSDGRFQIDGVPPGHYRAVAVPAIAHDSVQDPAVLERLQEASQPLRVTSGQYVTLTCRLSAATVLARCR